MNGIQILKLHPLATLLYMWQLMGVANVIMYRVNTLTYILSKNVNSEKSSPPLVISDHSITILFPHGGL